MFEKIWHMFGRKTKSDQNQGSPEVVDFKLLAEHNNDVIFKCGITGTATYVSPSSLKVLGWAPEEIVGKGPADFVLPEDLPAVIAAQMQHRDGEEASAVAYRMKRKDGSVVWVEGSARTVADCATGMPELVVVMRDITERKKLEEQLSALAMADGLTGLANRRAFDAALGKEWARIRRGNGQLSLLLIDLDHFKAFNDHYGHQVGDDCLRSVATAIRLAVRRPADLVARYGGEEIVIILPDTASPGAIKIAKDIQRVVELLRVSHDRNETGGGIVTMSIGAATALSRAGASVQMPAGLLQAADMALYKAKSQGRNRVETALLLSGGGAISSRA